MKNKSLLPHGTRNIYNEKSFKTKNELNPKNYKGLNYKEGERNVSLGKWRLFYDDKGKLNKPVYGHFLCSRYLQSINNTCVINVVNSRENQDGTIVTYAKGAFTTCKKFKVICTKSILTAKIELFSSGLNFRHSHVRMTRPVRNVERMIHGEKMKHTAPDVYRRQLVFKTDSHKVRAGNLDKIKSLNTLEKISSEHKSKDDLDKDDYLDILKMKKQKVVYQRKAKADKYLPAYGYIQRLSEYPFCVHLYD